MYLYLSLSLSLSLYIYIYSELLFPVPCFVKDEGAKRQLRPVHLLRVLLLRVLESNFPGDSL